MGRVYLGSEPFIDRLCRDVAGAPDPEIPRRQREPLWLSAETVLHRVARAYRVPVAELSRPSRRPSEARHVALCGLRRQTELGLQAIARRKGLT